ncbi:MAG: hypothetical protein VR64_20105 [Desulfatitalea sp. BRH_c12]|nr:MAG: hypothetical protein VR64_20105 [Desulfatitalea sp. BRH_c12]
MVAATGDARKCLDSALRLLGGRDHGCAELSQKLKRRGFAPPDISQAITECRRLGYLDDRRFCSRFMVQKRRKGYGPLRIAQMLRSKGVSADLVDEAIASNEEAQIEDCRRALVGKVNRDSNARASELKLYRFLLQRGFAPSIVRQVLKASMQGM